MRWSGFVIALLACLLSACGNGQKQQGGGVRTGSVANGASANDVLSVAGLGTFEGRCPRGASSWALRFLVTAGANESISYRVGNGPRRTVNVNPGKAITIHLVPNASKTHEPADRFIPPIGQGRGVSTAVSVPTTAPLHAVLYQATEPQTLLADVYLALSTIGGESAQCILAGSAVHAYTYPNG